MSADFEPFMAFDFETANSRRSSACAFGCAIVRGFDDIETHCFRIRPPELKVGHFQYMAHGLTSRELSDCEEWPAVWDKVGPWFSEMPAIAHNLTFDLAVLKVTNAHYGIVTPDIKTHCTLKFLRKACPECTNHQLSTLAEFFGISLAHHQADQDAAACAMIMLKIMKSSECPNLSSMMKRSWRKSAVVQEACESIVGSPFSLGPIAIDVHKDDVIAYTSPAPGIVFSGKAFSFTGDFFFERQDAITATECSGGIIHERPKATTDYLVVGRNGSDAWLQGDAGGSKVQHALKLRGSGKPIAVVSECAWATALLKTSEAAE